MAQEELKKILHLLDENNINYKHLEHEEIKKDSKSAAVVRGTKLEQGAKALILKTKSGKLIQAVLPANRRLDLKKIKRLLNEKNVSLVSPEIVLEKINCVVGSVPPLANLWGIEILMDKILLEKEEIVFSAGTLTDSIMINPKDLAKVNGARIEEIIKEEPLE